MIATQYSPVPADNSGAVPVGSPEGTTLVRDLNNVDRHIMASIREILNGDGFFNLMDGTPNGTYSYETATSFSVNGLDCRAIYYAGRTLRITQNAVQFLAKVQSVSYAGSKTIVQFTGGTIASGSLTIECLGAPVGPLDVNGKVSKSGDSMTGGLTSPNFESNAAFNGRALGFNGGSFIRSDGTYVVVQMAGAGTDQKLYFNGFSDVMKDGNRVFHAGNLVAATPTTDGLMSSFDKAKINNIPQGTIGAYKIAIQNRAPNPGENPADQIWFSTT